MHTVTALDLLKLRRPKHDGSKTDNGQITIIGGSDLFHGAPILALRAASRLVDMVFFSSPHNQFELLALQLKSQLASFIWVPFEEIDPYIAKSDAILLGPGMKRYGSEHQAPALQELDQEGQQTKLLCERLLSTHAQKQWVIDAGALQTIETQFIPPSAILTPNHREFTHLFLSHKPNSVDDLDETTFKQLPPQDQGTYIQQQAQKYNCTIMYKAPLTIAASPHHVVAIPGGNAGLSKGGIGDTLAGVTTALAATNEPLVAASLASYIVKSAADELYLKTNYAYNAQDLTEQIPLTFNQLVQS